MVKTSRYLIAHFSLIVLLFVFSFIPAYHTHSDHESHSDCSYCLASGTTAPPLDIKVKPEFIVTVSLLPIDNHVQPTIHFVSSTPARAPPCLSTSI